MNVMMHIPKTNSILLGPAGFRGTEALWSVVNAGVWSVSLARACCTCPCNAV